MLSVEVARLCDRVGADKGLGYLILTTSGTMNTAAMFGVLLILSALGIVCFYAVAIIERVFCPWYTATELN